MVAAVAPGASQEEVEEVVSKSAYGIETRRYRTLSTVQDEAFSQSRGC